MIVWISICCSQIKQFWGDKMKQNKILKEMYKASLGNDKSKLKELYKTEIAKILEKRREGKMTFCSKWLVTDER